MRRESASYGSAMRRPLALGALLACLLFYVGFTREADRGFWRLVDA